MPRPTINDDATPERACQAFATGMLDLTRFAIASK
jgi:hypothetical protein